MQFLTGLNDTFDGVRSHLLLQDPLPNINKVYSLVLRDEKQKPVYNSVPDTTENAAMLATTSSTKQGFIKDISDARHVKKDLNRFYNYCKKEGHTKDSYFELFGYLDWYKGSKDTSIVHKSFKVGNHWNRSMNSSKTSNSNRFAAQVQALEFPITAFNKDPTIPSKSDDLSIIIQSAVQQEFQKFFKGKGSMESNFANFFNIVGMSTPYYVFCSLSKNIDRWIIDTGATNHMSPYISLFSTSIKLEPSKPIFSPNGHVTLVTHTSSISLHSTMILGYALFVHGFKHNLLSISKLSKFNKIKVIFYPTGCLFQDLQNDNILVIGKEDNGLYKIDSSYFHFTSSQLSSIIESGTPDNFFVNTISSKHFYAC